MTATVKYELQLPEYVIKSLGLKDSEVEGTLKQELAVHFFQKNRLSFGQARRLAGLSVWDFLTLLKDRKVPLHYELSDYEEDLKTIKGLL